MFAFVVFDLVFSTKPRDWLGRTSPKSLIFCWFGRRILTRSILWSDINAVLCGWKAVNENIADEKTSCMECFASVALCEQLRRADTDPAIRNLLKQRPLDPFRENLMKSIRSTQSYVNGEVTKANAALDDQWQEYQSRQNKKLVIIYPLWWGQERKGKERVFI